MSETEMALHWTAFYKQYASAWIITAFTHMPSCIHMEEKLYILQGVLQHKHSLTHCCSIMLICSCRVWHGGKGQTFLSESGCALQYSQTLSSIPSWSKLMELRSRAGVLWPFWHRDMGHSRLSSHSPQHQSPNPDEISQPARRSVVVKHKHHWLR